MSTQQNTILKQPTHPVKKVLAIVFAVVMTVFFGMVLYMYFFAGRAPVLTEAERLDRLQKLSESSDDLNLTKEEQLESLDILQGAAPTPFVQ